jgi:hypothetical protein
LGRTWEASFVEADELLAKIQIPVSEEAQQGTKCKGGHHGFTWLPCISHLEDDRAAGLEEPPEGRGKFGKPCPEILALQIPISLLSVERKRRRGQD